MNQINIHHSIKDLLSLGVESASSKQVAKLINLNDDSRQYFYSNVDESWLKWLWENHFLDEIKDKAKDPNTYVYRMPELMYLVRASKNESEIVTDFMCSFYISIKNFNPEVVDQFTRIAGNLPAKCLKDLVVKIREEKWIVLMGKYTQHGFDYEDMLKTLREANDCESILILAEAILQLKPKKQSDKRSPYESDDLFLIRDITETKIFTYLRDISVNYIEQALQLIVNIFKNVIEQEKDYLLMDEDLFNLKLSSLDGDHYREDIKALVATILELTNKLFSSNISDKKDIYNKYFFNLRAKQLSRRLKLYILSLDPALFINELKIEYFKLFTAKNKLEVLYGAEYERALKVGFPHLEKSLQHEYFTKTIELFSDTGKDEEVIWNKHYGSCILSTISEQLTKDERDLVLEHGFKIDSKYRPKPSIGKISSGTVTPRSPVDLAKLDVVEISNKLKNELSPDELKKRYVNDDFLNPRDADGVGEQLKSDIKQRINDYLTHATLFFDRDKLIPHYTNAYLRGIKEALAENRSNSTTLNYSNLIRLLINIKKTGENNPFDKNHDLSQGRWLSDWNSVHATIANLIEELIKQKEKTTLLNFVKYRKEVLEILEYILNYHEPLPEDEQLQTAKTKIKDTGDKDYLIGDPFTIAINSVRGQAMQTLLHFVYQDARNFSTYKLADDVKSLYEHVLEKEDTRAIMFMFGHYLPTFYYRAPEWTREMMGNIFESKSKDKYLKYASWEGYLSSNLYKEIFFEKPIQKMYEKYITLKLKYPQQKFFKDPHEAISIHFALAYIHYEEFNFNDPLFKKFIASADALQLTELVKFIGKSYVAGDSYSILKDKDSDWRVKRVMKIWSFMLKNQPDSPAIKEFGMWIDTNKAVFDIEWLATKICQTLKATKGELEWEYGLVKSIETIAAITPKEALIILERHFFGMIRRDKYFYPIRDDKEWYSAFKTLYNNQSKDIHSSTYKLINKLIEKGGQSYWELEKILSSS